MDFVPFSIESKEVISDFFRAERVEASDLLFGNLYIWHFSREIEYVILKDCLCVKTKYKDEEFPFMFFPLGKGDKKGAILELREYFLDNKIPFSFRQMEKAQSEKLNEFMPDRFEILANRDRFDYVYKVSDLINLSGKKLHNKKNHFNRFLNTYPTYIYESIDSKNALEVLSVYTQWCADNPNFNEGLKSEFLGIKASLENFEKLNFKGGILRIDDRIAAFSLGEQINDNSVVIHIEKGNIFYTGIYQAINQQFLAHAWQNLEFVNREEDLGIEGLRHAKMTYHPAYFVEKFNAKEKE